MKCEICGVEVASGEFCTFCSELKSSIECDPELAAVILDRVRTERNQRSPLGPLRDEIVSFVARLQAEDLSEEGEQLLAWADVLVDGVRGLSCFSDEELLLEFSGLLGSSSGEDASLARSLEERLEEFPIWNKMEEKRGTLADDAGLDDDLA